MPLNFWLDAKIDGRKTDWAAGPLSASGGFSESVYIRDQGVPRKAVRLVGEVAEGGLLTLRVLDVEGVEVYRVEARR